MTMMMIITINIADISFGISQKTEGPPISQNRIKVKRRRLLVHPIIQNRTTHTRAHTIIPGSIQKKRKKRLILPISSSIS